jgi:hypothetical protein
MASRPLPDLWEFQMPELLLFFLAIYAVFVLLCTVRDYVRWTVFNSNRPEWWFTILMIVLLAIPSMFNEDDETGILYGRLQRRADSRHSNAADIKAERKLLLSLRLQPLTQEIRDELKASRSRLEQLRQHDLRMEAAVALQTRAAELASATDTARLTREAEAEAQDPLPGYDELAERRPGDDS